MNLHKNKLIWLIALSFLFICSHLFLLAGNEDKIEDKDEKTLSEIKNILSTSDNPKEKLNKILFKELWRYLSPCCVNKQQCLQNKKRPMPCVN